MGKNPGYLLKSFLLYKIHLSCYNTWGYNKSKLNWTLMFGIPLLEGQNDQLSLITFSRTLSQSCTIPARTYEAQVELNRCLKSWGLEATPLATHSFNRSYKISNPPLRPGIDLVVRDLACHVISLNAGCLWVTVRAIPGLHNFKTFVANFHHKPYQMMYEL